MYFILTGWHKVRLWHMGCNIIIERGLKRIPRQDLAYVNN